MALQQVVFWRALDANNRNLYLIKEDGTNIVTVADGAGIHTYKTAAPGGRLIYETIVDQQTDVFSVKTDGTGTLNLTNTTKPEHFQAVTPAGDVIFSREERDAQGEVQMDIYRVSADGSQTCAVAASAASEVFLRLAANGDVIYKKCASGFCSDLSGDGQLYAATCNDTKTLTDTTVAGEPWFIGISSSGRAVYMQWDEAAQQHVLYSVAADGSDRKTLVTADGAFLSPYLHGDDIVYALNGNLYRIGVGGDDTTVLADSSELERYQAVTADGRLIYATGRASGPASEANGLYSVRLDGTDRQVLANSEYREIFDGVSPTGRVMFQSYPVNLDNPQHGHELHSIKADGSDDQLLSGTSTVGVFKQIEDVSPTHRVLYRTIRTTGDQYDLSAVNEDGTDDRFLGSGIAYGAATNNDRVIYTNACTTYTLPDAPPKWMLCRDARGDVMTIKSDGTGTTPLATGSEDEGFEALY
ncbi:MAG: DUF5050 domain-containing protein [Gammaproteobacteria bacterium]|nr:DUF5050 domain-containing protein [Gammaproteobacteria bacterium]